MRDFKSMKARSRRFFVSGKTAIVSDSIYTNEDEGTDTNHIQETNNLKGLQRGKWSGMLSLLNPERIE